MFDYTEKNKIKNKKTNKQHPLGSCLRERLSKQQLQLKMVNKKEEQFEIQPLIDCPTCR